MKTFIISGFLVFAAISPAVAKGAEGKALLENDTDTLSYSSTGDGRIGTAVQQRLFDSLGKQAHSIRVVVHAGVAYLSGSLPSQLDVERAVSASFAAPGVTDVKSYLLVAGSQYMSGQVLADLRAAAR